MVPAQNNSYRHVHFREDMGGERKDVYDRQLVIFYEWISGCLYCIDSWCWGWYSIIK